MPVIAKSAFALPTSARTTEVAPISIASRFRNFRQGANSASTANVTRMRISVYRNSGRAKARHYKFKTEEQHPRLACGRAGHCYTNNLCRGRVSNLFCAARRDVTVGLVPADGALECCGGRAGLKSKFLLRAVAIHKHHML